MTSLRQHAGLPLSIARKKLVQCLLALGVSLTGQAKADPAALAHFMVATDRAGPARTISFGQVFRAGQVRPNDHLVALLDGRLADLQMDAKALNHDGSVRHAVVTIALPQLGARTQLSGVIISGDGAVKASDQSRKAFAAPPLEVTISMISPSGAAQVHKIDLMTIARDPKAEVGHPWIDGSLAQERRFVSEVNDNIEVVFDVFVPRAGPSRVDVIVHNDWVTAHKRDTASYDIEMRIAGKSVFAARSVHQYPFSTWHHLIWSDGAQAPRIIPDVDELISNAAIPSYSTSSHVSDDLLTELAHARSSNTSPLHVSIVTMHMPDTGGRWDIGPLPTWAVAYLLSKQSSIEDVLFETADEAGAIPWHIRERTSRSPLTIDEFPNLWLDGRGDPVPGALPESFEAETDGWTIDDSHQPSLVYLPYLLTGSQYYRDELSQQAAFVLLSFDPDYRGKSHGYIVGEDGDPLEQERALAWSLRTIANAAFILPSNDRLQSYFDAKLKGNLAQIVNLYLTKRILRSAGEVEGWIPGIDVATDGVVYPWQQSFIAIVLGWINDMGYADAGRILTWTSGFTCGIFTNAGNGFDPSRGIAYTLDVYDTDQHRNFSTWREVFQHSEVRTSEEDELEEWRHDYGAITRAGLGATLKVVRTDQCRRAYRYVGELITPDDLKDPTFMIVPKLPGAGGTVQ